MTGGIKKEKLLQCVRETETHDSGVGGITGPENFEWQKQCCEVAFVKEVDLND